jgi:site-specific recombinase XerD
MQISPLHGEFLTYLDLERGHSHLTISAYRSDARMFLECLDGTDQEARLDDIDRQCIQGYITWMRKRSLNPNTVGRRIHSLRSFWTHLLENEYVEQNPFRGIAIPKRQRPAPVHLTTQECAAVLAATERQSNPLLAFRDRAVLPVLIHTGLRRAELLARSLGSVDLDEALLLVECGKGRKPRLVPLGHQPVDARRDWLDLRPECEHEAFLTS